VRDALLHHGVTVMEALVASTVVELLRKNRRLYVPGAVGIVKVSVAPLTPLAGAVGSPFRN
jgi:hypothetical protein